MMDHIITIILALISSGALVSFITHVFDRKRSNAEVEQLRQQIDAARTDDKIKIDDYIKKQLMEITESYKRESEDRKAEIAQLQSQNEELQKQVCELTTQINQVLSWIYYDMLGYQKWLEKELTDARPDIDLPKYHKPPRFVRDFVQSQEEAEVKVKEVTSTEEVVETPEGTA
jgi:hypothetical protein